ncbi:PREDICTED: nicalin-1-like [Amphimedon queenslandica]|uniref:TIR domain-containing protein n=1 Tax=Amphimedon queenslandica TaxID=400682 RepID=A0AAN0JXB9_AMPQE|nr:PREDICTED: nicalin-1-like [Amphimedon queenslandica]|eukprot:XP_019861588.1 PREDICTED: nicalin-1-like [Amphimedon queenslandica]
MLLFSLFDSLEGSLPLYLLLPLLCLTASVQSVQEFTIYRIQHLDIHGSHIGSRSAVVNMEARSPEAAMLNRKCVLIKWTELTSDLFNELLERGAGAVLIILPNDWRNNNNNNNNTLHEWMLLEKELISREISIPIYLTTESEYLNEVYDKLTSSVDWDSSAAAGKRHKGKE